MAIKKKYLVVVDEGGTLCNECPFRASKCNTDALNAINCNEFNLSTMKIKEPISYEELQEFAKQYSHNIWEQLMQRFKADDKFYIGANDVSDYILNAILDTYQKMMEEEK